MILKITELELYKDVMAGTEDATQEYAPAGEFSIEHIDGEAAFDINCAVSVWFDGAVVWLTKGSSEMNRQKMFTGDGVKKVILKLDANDLPSGSVYLGGYVRIQEII